MLGIELPDVVRGAWSAGLREDGRAVIAGAAGVCVPGRAVEGEPRCVMITSAVGDLALRVTLANVLRHELVYDGLPFIPVEARGSWRRAERLASIVYAGPGEVIDGVPLSTGGRVSGVAVSIPALLGWSIAIPGMPPVPDPVGVPPSMAMTARFRWLVGQGKARRAGW